MREAENSESLKVLSPVKPFFSFPQIPDRADLKRDRNSPLLISNLSSIELGSVKLMGKTGEEIVRGIQLGDRGIEFHELVGLHSRHPQDQFLLFSNFRFAMQQQVTARPIIYDKRLPFL